MQTELLTATRSNSKPARGRILIVDDEEPNRLLLRDPLEAQGYDVEEAENGLEALHRMERGLSDSVLLDVMMPGMDGFQVCRRLKAEPKTAHVPILMVTALSERKERLQGIQAGANDFLNKPVDIQDLTLRVANAVYTKRLFDQLQLERQKSEHLLFNALPQPIAERIRQGEINIADHHPEVTLLVADLAGFTTLAAHIAPQEVVSLLNEIFSNFDLLVERHQLDKIKTIGDAYLAAAGLSAPRPDHAEASIQLALDMSRELAEFNRQYETQVRLRIGIHTGPVIAGVIGRKRYAYDVWGDTVNATCRLEAAGQPQEILVSETTYERVENRFRFDGRRLVELKGRGPLTAFRLCGPV
jgi:adenylate cyclase